MKLQSFLILSILFIFSSISWSQSLYAYRHKDLTFGDVFIGYAENVRHFDDRAAKFSFYHTQRRRRDLLVTFNLPTVLSNGIDKLPIRFGRRNSAWSYRDRIRNRRRFNPNYPLEIRRVANRRTVYLWLGGAIKTNTSLSPGNYRGTIILTVEYL